MIEIGLLSVLILIFCQGWAQESPYPFNKELLLTGKTSRTVSLFWRVDFDKELIFFKLQSQLNPGEWLVFGFSNHGNYESSDIFILTHVRDTITLVVSAFNNSQLI